jgi:acylphosphatase
MQLARLYRIRGRVQGVGFRYFTQRTAVRLGVRGWVRNLPNGDVEVQAEASTIVLGQFREELRRGPRSAEVAEVLEQEIEPADHSTFHIRD